MFNAIRHDLRYTIRSLSRQPGFLAAVVATLALGIGANTVIFTIFYSVILRPLPYPNPEQLVSISQAHGGNRYAVSPRNFLAWKENLKSFSEVIGLGATYYAITGNAHPEQVVGLQVSSRFFTMLGVNPKLGRGFREEEEIPGQPAVVLLSDELWTRHYAADRNVLGKAVTLNGKSHRIIGVLPASFQWPSAEVMLWTPGNFKTEAGILDRHNMEAIGRVKPGVSIAEAQQEMAVLTANLAREFPNATKGWETRIRLLHDEVVGDVWHALWILLGAVWFVLSIACANVANLLLGRGASRHKEIAIRSALGAGRGFLVRQLLTESLFLSFSGGALALLIAYGGLKLLVLFNPGVIPRGEEIHISGPVLLFTFVLCTFIGALFALVPVRQLLTGGSVFSALKESGRSSTAGRASQSFRNGLVVAQIAFSLVLLMGAGLLLRSYLQLQSIHRGFQSEHLLTVRLSLPSSGSSESETIGLYQRILDRIETLPGVQGVAATTNVPLDGQQAVGMRFSIDGGPPVPRSERPAAVTQLINPDFLQTMGIPIRQGRPFTPQDRASSPLVAIVSDSLARRYWPDGSPIGRYLIVNSPSARVPKNDLRREVVGVAADIVYPTRKAHESVEIYLPYLQNMWPNVFLFIRTRTEPASLVSAVRRIVSEIDPQQSISRVQTMEERIAKINGKPRWNTVVLGLFALLAVILAGVGIYGVIAYSVSQRTQEIGVRMALGAKPSDIVRLILKTGVWTACAGLALGLMGCYFLSRLLATLIFGISSHDPLTLGAASALLALVALLASYLPARRATKLNPVAALREQ